MQYLVYFLVGGGATTLIAYYNTHGSPGLAAILGCMPMHFLTNVLIAALVAGPAVALSFSRTSFITNFGWVGAVLAFILVYEHTNNLLIATLACAAAGVVLNMAMNEAFHFV